MLLEIFLNENELKSLDINPRSRPENLVPEDFIRCVNFLKKKMTTFIVGDVQGCYQELEELLTKCGFEKGNDHLWLVGDLINRGPENVAVLDWIINTPNVTSVLGNHDLHFLAIAIGREKQTKGDTLDDLLESPRRDIYIDYLRNLPLIHTTAGNEKVLVHAGLPPNIDIQSCLSLANEVEEVLKSRSNYQLSRLDV